MERNNDRRKKTYGKRSDDIDEDVCVRMDCAVHSLRCTQTTLTRIYSVKWLLPK